MKLSTRARYGTRALLDIALNSNGGPVLLREIAKRQQISLLYLERVITPLVAAGIIRSTRGARGGVWLAKSPRDIKLSDVIRSLEGSLAPVECTSDPTFCSRAATCVTRDLWSEIQKSVDDVLEATTLQDLVDRQRAKEQPETAMYYI